MNMLLTILVESMSNCISDRGLLTCHLYKEDVERITVTMCKVSLLFYMNDAIDKLERISDNNQSLVDEGPTSKIFDSCGS